MASSLPSVQAKESDILTCSKPVELERRDPKRSEHSPQPDVQSSYGYQLQRDLRRLVRSSPPISNTTEFSPLPESGGIQLYPYTLAPIGLAKGCCPLFNLISTDRLTAVYEGIIEVIHYGVHMVIDLSH